MPRRTTRIPSASALLLPILLAVQPALAADNNTFCGGAATPGDPSDLANVVGDQTLEYAVQQPASIVTCAKGYLLEKCGDHENAHKVFDKCIAAGYVGAMIWKALLLEDGTGVTRDLETAARLLHRAATSGDPAYGPLGKLHYATMLLQGKGVERNEAEALRWFQSAADDGNPDAREFLKTGYHTGARDQTTLGAGTPPPGALVAGLTGDNASIPTVNPKKQSISQNPSANVDAPHADPSPAYATTEQRRALKPLTASDRPALPLRPIEPASPPDQATEAPLAEPQPSSASRRLTPVETQPVESNAGHLWVSIVLAIALAIGVIRQGRLKARPNSQMLLTRG